MKRIAVLVGLVALLASLSTAEAQKKLDVVASFYPLFEFAKRVGGERAEVLNLVPAGSPHDWEPTPKDIERIAKADVFIYNGADLDDKWVKEVLEAIGRCEKPIVVDATKGAELRKVKEEGAEETDPHLWLDPILVRDFYLPNILVGFVAADAAGRSVYESGAREFQAKLSELDSKIRDGLADCRLRLLIISHRFLDYFAERYKLQSEAVCGLEPCDPSPKRLAELTKLARQHGIKHVFAEPGSLKIIEPLARELGAQVLILNPLEALTDEEQKAGKNYLTVMEENLKNLRIGLECK